jgi:hypothetical protein
MSDVPVPPAPARADRAVETQDAGSDAMPEDPTERAISAYSAWDGNACEPAIPLAAYAAVSAELSEDREPRHVVLARYRLDEASWAVQERAWLEKMADRTMQGDATLAVAYGELFMAAQDRLARPEEAGRTLEDYAGMLAAVERHGDITDALKPWSMTLAEWMRLDRTWSARAEADPTVTAEIERRLREERARLVPEEAEEDLVETERGEPETRRRA